MIGNYSSQSDKILVEFIKQGDTSAFKELYYRYYSQLFRYAYYRVFSSEISRDLIQDLFIKVWNKKADLNPEKSIKAYLYRALTNLIINYRRLKSSQNISYEDAGRESTAAETDLNTSIDIQSAIDKLPDNIQTVYILSRIEGYKYIEIAELLGLSVKAIEKRMSKALSILRNHFK